MKKLLAKIAMVATLIAPMALPLVASAAVQPNWNTTGTYTVDFTCNVGCPTGPYGHDMVLAQDTLGNLTGHGGSPVGSNVYTWVITSGTVSGTALDFFANYTATADAVTPQTVMHVSGTVATNGTISGTWSDNYAGGTRSGTWSTTSGMAVLLSAEDFGVVNYDTGLGFLKGYTAGFGLTNATFAGATSVVVKLYAAGDVLLQTNTAILPKFNADITGTQFSSPFDVSGNFAYATDGYWTNVRESQYGQSVPAVKVVATVTLASGKVVSAENTALVGDPTTIYPVVTPPEPVAPPIDKDECKDGGWATFNNPSFPNQGQCEKYVKDHEKDGNGKAKGDIKMSGPSQKIKFDVSSKNGKGDKPDKDKGNVEYWNYDYPEAGGVLHYKAKAECVYVNKDTHEARFMFQIPDGHPGLSGLYVVASVMDLGKHGAGDTYAHTATADLATAKSICENGGSFTSYTITSGDVKVNK